MCTREDALAYILGAPFIDGVMSYNLLTTVSFEDLRCQFYVNFYTLLQNYKAFLNHNTLTKYCGMLL